MNSTGRNRWEYKGASIKLHRGTYFVRTPLSLAWVEYLIDARAFVDAELGA